MPVFVIHMLGKAAQRLLLDSPPVRVGRDVSNDIVISDETVSREHATFVRDGQGRWHVGCVSETNPIVVDGTLITQSASVVEGTEVLVGAGHMITFAESEATAEKYMGAATRFAKSQCGKCNWEGMVSLVRKDPVCPRCGGTQMVRADVYKPEGKGVGAFYATAAVSPEEAKEMFKKMKIAKGSRIERMDARPTQSPRTKLTEDKPLRFARDAAVETRLGGFAFGQVIVSWNGENYVAESAMVLPAMRVNGVKARSHVLVNGDVLEMGSNRFRYLTD